MEKYNINKEFGFFGKFTPTLSKSYLFFTKLGSSIIHHNPLTFSKDLEITTKKITTENNDKIKIHLFNPLKVKTDKIVLYIHGGGFLSKGNPSNYKLCKEYALKGNCKIIYVNYRLAPKNKYPIPLNDCYEAYKWIIDNAKSLEIDPNKIIIMGVSAGGCIAADIVRKCKTDKIIKPHHLMLIYPTLDKRMTTNSMKQYKDTPMWNSILNKKVWEYYLGDQEYISPNEENNLDYYPETYIETAEYDCLHDEGVEFAEKLKKSKVKVLLNETKNTMHGFDIKDCKLTRNIISKRIKELKRI